MSKTFIPCAKQTLLFGLFLVMFSSCATLFNRSYMDVEIKANESLQLVYNNDTLSAQPDQGIRIPVKNQKEPLALIAIGESETKAVAIRSKKGSVYWSNFFTLPIWGAGFLVDEISGKKFNYPNKVFIDFKKPGNSYYPYFPMKDELIAKKNLFGINPFGFFREAHPMVEVSYERIMNRQLSSRFTYGHLLDVDNEFSRDSEGFQASLEQKYYYRNEDRTRLYVSLVLEHLNKSHLAELTLESTSDLINDPFGSQFTQQSRVKKVFTSLTPRIGFQTYLGDGFILEGFAGLGMRHRKVSHPDVDPRFRVVDDGGGWLFTDIDLLSNRAENRLTSNWDLGFRLIWAF